jgi:hypothetical protein
MEEIEYPIVHPLKTDPKLIDSVPEEVCLRTPQLMTQLLEPLDPHKALVLCFGRDGIEPIEYWYSSIVIPKKDDLDPRHALLPIIRNIANIVNRPSAETAMRYESGR